MSLEGIGQIVFAVAVVVAAVSLVAAALDRVARRVLVALAVALGVTALAAWIAFGFRPGAELAVVAGGITLAFLAELAAIRLLELFRAARRVDEQLARAHGRLSALVARAADEANAELERILVLARADSASQLTEQERRIAEEHRVAAAERSRAAGAELAAALLAAQQQVDARLNAWHDDLERAQRGAADQIAQLAQRQKQLIGEAEARITADAERLEGESEQQREAVVRLRDDLTRATQDAMQAGTTELDEYGAQRRRALHEINERIRQRERQLLEQLEREEGEAMRRIQASFADVERKQIEQLERILKRATSSYADAAAQQFETELKTARENAGRRLARENERAVEAFGREAQTILADRLSQVGDTGAQRLEKRMSQATESLERRRVEAIAELESRMGHSEHELRRRLDGLSADIEAERAVLDARLRELARRIDETFART